MNDTQDNSQIASVHVLGSPCKAVIYEWERTHPAKQHAGFILFILLFIFVFVKHFFQVLEAILIDA